LEREEVLVFDDLGEPEVGELDVAFAVDEEVFGLEVAVGDVLGVEVLEGQQDLGEVEQSDVIREAA
jgi:hypothetical protein